MLGKLFKTIISIFFITLLSSAIKSRQQYRSIDQNSALKSLDLGNFGLCTLEEKMRSNYCEDFLHYGPKI